MQEGLSPQRISSSEPKSTGGSRGCTVSFRGGKRALLTLREDVRDEIIK